MKNEQILVELQDWMGDDAAVANAAWTSTYDKVKRDQRYEDPDKIKFVIEERLFGQEDAHNVPVESVIFRFWIRHPVFSDRQHQTHRIQSSNGLSGRYRTLPLDYFNLPDDVCDIVTKVDDLVPNDFPTTAQPNVIWSIFDAYYESCEITKENYSKSVNKLKRAESLGVITNAEYKRAREIVRGQMPVANMTERTTIMNLGAFANYQRKRNSSHAQPEIRQVAEMMLEEIKRADICPITIACLEKRNWKL